MRHFNLLLSLLSACVFTIGSALGQDEISDYGPEFDAGIFTCNRWTYGETSNPKTTLRCEYFDGFSTRDKCHFYLDSKAEVEAFCSDLEEAWDYMNAGNEATGKWKPKDVPVDIHAPFAGYICIWPRKYTGERGYGLIETKEANVRTIKALRAAADSIWP